MLAENPNPQTETRRALLVALVDWVTKGKQPPPSEYPRVSDGTLVPATANAMHWPKIPGAPTPDNVMNVLMDYDYGPEFRYNDESGVMTNVVPPIKQVIPTPAAKVDEDGNEIAGVKSVLLQAPLGTYTSWNPIASGPLKGNEGSLAAGYIPFAMTKAERLASGDPRRSVEERYGSQEVIRLRSAACRQAPGPQAIPASGGRGSPHCASRREQCPAERPRQFHRQAPVQPTWIETMIITIAIIATTDTEAAAH